MPNWFEGKDLKEIYGDSVSHFIISHDAHKSLYESSFAFICSGTATLESALIGTPFVLAYRAKKIDAFIVRLLIKLKYVGLANILYSKIDKNREGLMHEDLHTELLQEMVNEENLINAYKNMDRERFFMKASKLRKYLMHGSSQSVADTILGRESIKK